MASTTSHSSTTGAAAGSGLGLGLGIGGIGTALCVVEVGRDTGFVDTVGTTGIAAFPQVEPDGRDTGTTTVGTGTTVGTTGNETNGIDSDSESARLLLLLVLTFAFVLVLV